jgi:hypothetical protein
MMLVIGLVVSNYFFIRITRFSPFGYDAVASTPFQLRMTPGVVCEPPQHALLKFLMIPIQPHDRWPSFAEYGLIERNADGPAPQEQRMPLDEHAC